MADRATDCRKALEEGRKGKWGKVQEIVLGERNAIKLKNLQLRTDKRVLAAKLEKMKIENREFKRVMDQQNEKKWEKELDYRRREKKLEDLDKKIKDARNANLAWGSPTAGSAHYVESCRKTKAFAEAKEEQCRADLSRCQIDRDSYRDQTRADAPELSTLLRRCNKKVEELEKEKRGSRYERAKKKLEAKINKEVTQMENQEECEAKLRDVASRWGQCQEEVKGHLANLEEVEKNVKTAQSDVALWKGRAEEMSNKYMKCESKRASLKEEKTQCLFELRRMSKLARIVANAPSPEDYDGGSRAQPDESSVVGQSINWDNPATRAAYAAAGRQQSRASSRTGNRAPNQASVREAAQQVAKEQPHRVVDPPTNRQEAYRLADEALHREAVRARLAPYPMAHPAAYQADHPYAYSRAFKGNDLEGPKGVPMPYVEDPSILDEIYGVDNSKGKGPLSRPKKPASPAAPAAPANPADPANPARRPGRVQRPDHP